jgi:hypothetical protein
MHTTIFFLSMARHALRAATGDPFPEREEVVGILTRVGEIAETHIARASAPPSTPAANDRAPEHVCPFAACADSGLLANGEVCACAVAVAELDSAAGSGFRIAWLTTNAPARGAAA